MPRKKRSGFGDVVTDRATFDRGEARCPQCRNPIRALKVVKLSRSKVAFTSTLPRAGRATVCPQCECILSVEISGVI